MRAQSTKDRTLHGVLLFASTDRAPLRGVCRSTYGTNQRLATARGEAVAQWLKDKSMSVPYTIVTSGPTELNEASVAADRSVTIYGLIGRSSSSQ